MVPLFRNTASRPAGDGARFRCVYGAGPGLKHHLDDGLRHVVWHILGGRHRDLGPEMVEAVISLDHVAFGEVPAGPGEVSGSRRWAVQLRCGAAGRGFRLPSLSLVC